MSNFDTVFKEIFSKFDTINRRLKQFETWEPTDQFPWIGDVSAHARRSTSLALAGGAWAPITFDAETWDTDSINAAGTFTIPATGKYLLMANLNFLVFNGTFTMQIYRDANTNIQGTFDGNYAHANLSGIMSLAASETIILRAIPALATSVVGVAANPYHSFFQIQRVG